MGMIRVMLVFRVYSVSGLQGYRVLGFGVGVLV